MAVLTCGFPLAPSIDTIAACGTSRRPSRRRAGVSRRHAVRAAWSARIAPGCPVNVSAITLSPHVGAHADAPLHYARRRGRSARSRSTPYLGRCRVIHAIGRGPLVEVEHLAHAADGLPPRVLVRTCERAPTAWVETSPPSRRGRIDWLAERGVLLVGIDTASVDPAASKTLDAISACARTTCACSRIWSSTRCPRATTS